METKQEVIEKLKKEILSSKAAGDGEDEANWQYEKGVLLTQREASEIISLLEAEGTGKWVKVEDGKPKAGQRVVCFYINNIFMATWTALQYFKGDAGNEKSVTHWMPLPKVPTE